MSCICSHPSGTAGYDSDERFRQTHCVFRGVTEKGRMQEEIVANAQLFFEVFHLSPSVSGYSRANRGSRFDIFLPLADMEGKLRAKPVEDVRGGSERILIVDDEPALADIASTILSRLGYSVTAVTDSREALARFQRAPADFDLVITGYGMPAMTGGDLARQISQLRPDLPIILITGYSERVNQATTQAAGIRDYMVKPLTRQDLGSVVRRVLGG